MSAIDQEALELDAAWKLFLESHAPRRFFGDKYWNEPLKWNKTASNEGKRQQVFCASMADVFEDRPELEEPRSRLWTLMENTPMLDWLLLTKRPENLNTMALHPDLPKNAWIGTSVENQAMAEKKDTRITKDKSQYSIFKL